MAWFGVTVVITTSAEFEVEADSEAQAIKFAEEDALKAFEDGQFPGYAELTESFVEWGDYTDIPDTED